MTERGREKQRYRKSWANFAPLLMLLAAKFCVGFECIFYYCYFFFRLILLINFTFQLPDANFFNCKFESFVFILYLFLLCLFLDMLVIFFIHISKLIVYSPVALWFTMFELKFQRIVYALHRELNVGDT